MHGMHSRFCWGTFLPWATPLFHTFLWSNRSTIGRALWAALLDVLIQRISAVSSIFPSLRASCRVFWKWSYTKLQSVKYNNIWHLKSYVQPPNNKSKPVLGLAIKLEVEKYRLICLLILFEGVCTWNEPGGQSNKKWHYSRWYVEETNM